MLKTKWLHRHQHSGSYGLFLAWLLLITLMIVPVAICLWYIDTFGVDVPVYDQWVSVDILNRLFHGAISWTDIFFMQHNQSMAGIPLLLITILAQFDSYNLRAEMFAGSIFAIFAGIALLQLARKRFSKGVWSLLVGVPLFWLACSIRQYEGLLSGVLGGVDDIMSSAFFVLTICLLDDCYKVDLSLLLAMASAICCAFSFCNGLLILPLGALQLALTAFRMEKISKSKKFRAIAIWMIFSLLLGSIYFANHKPASNPGLASFGHYFESNPLVVVKFLLAFLGSPLCPSADVDTAVLVGFVLSALLMISIILIASKRESLQVSMVAPATLIVYAVTSGGLIAMARVQQFGLTQAMMSRYVAFGYLATAGLYLLLLSAHHLRPAVRTSLLTIVSIIIIAGSIATVSDALVWGGVIRYHRLVLANLLRTYKWQDSQSLRPLMPMPFTSIVLKLASFLEENHLSVFRDRLPTRCFAPVPPPFVHLESIVNNPPPSAAGQSVFTVDQHKEKYISFSGCAVDPKSRGPVGGVLICLDDKIDIPAAYGLDRPDIAVIMKRKSYLRSGFLASCLTSVIGPGAHSITFKILAPDKKATTKPTKSRCCA